MWVMRPASADDGPQVAAMVRSRAAWMRDRGLNGWDGWDSYADGYAAQATDPDFPVWVLTKGGELAGATCLLEESPAWFWTEAERQIPAFFVTSTVTDPKYAGRRLGYSMLRWVLDHAARTGKREVRRGTWEDGLVRYYTQVQGWQIVRRKERDGVTVTGLSRPAGLQPLLPITSSAA